MVETVRRYRTLDIAILYVANPMSIASATTRSNGRRLTVRKYTIVCLEKSRVLGNIIFGRLAEVYMKNEKMKY